MYIENDKKHLNVYKMTNSTCYEVIKGGKFMRKKILSVLLCATMVTAMMTGCGKSSDDKMQIAERHQVMQAANQADL